MFYEKKNDAEFFEKIAHETKKQTEAKSAIKHKNDHYTTHALFLCALFDPFGSFLLKLVRNVGEKTTLCALSLFFSSLAVRKGVNCDENTVRRAQIIIRIRLYHHITQREHFTQKRDLSQKKHGESGETGAHFRRGARVLSHRFSLKSFSSFRSSFFFSL